MNIFICAVAALLIATIADAQHLLWPASNTSLVPYSSCIFGEGFSLFKNSALTGDGAGGLIIWNAIGAPPLPDGISRTYALRLNANGSGVWPGNVEVAPAIDSLKGESFPQIIGDGKGGAYISWFGYPDTSTPNKFSQRLQYVTLGGAIAWGDSGYLLTPANASVFVSAGIAAPFVPQLDSDGGGGVVLCYATCAAPGDTAHCTLFAARIINQNGAPHFVWGPVVAQNMADTELIVAEVNPSVVSDGAGGMYVAWETVVSGKFFDHIERIANTGSVMWNHRLEKVSQAWMSEQFFFDIIRVRGGVVLTYDCEPAPQVITCAAVALRDDGSLRWGPEQLGGIAGGFGISDERGGMFMTFYDSLDANGISELSVAHLDSTGAQLFHPTANPPGVALGKNYLLQTANLALDPAGNVVCAWADSIGNVRMQDIETNSGAALWNSSVVPGDSGVCPLMQPDGSGGVFVVWTKILQTGNSLLSLALCGQHVTDLISSVNDAPIQLPQRISLEAGAPNPFSATTQLAYSLERRMPVEIAVSDLLGRNVAVIDQGVRDAGVHAIMFDGSQLASGIYFCSMIADGQRVVKTLVVQR